MAELKFVIPQHLNEPLQKLLEQVKELTTQTDKLAKGMKQVVNLSLPTKQPFDHSKIVHQFHSFSQNLRRFEQAIQNSTELLLRPLSGSTKIMIRTMDVTKVLSRLEGMGMMSIPIAGRLWVGGIGVIGGIAVIGMAVFEVMKFLIEKTFAMASLTVRDSVTAVGLGTSIGALRAFRITFGGRIPGAEQTLANVAGAQIDPSSMSYTILRVLKIKSLMQTTTGTVDAMIAAAHLVKSLPLGAYALIAQRSGLTTVFPIDQLRALRAMPEKELQEMKAKQVEREKKFFIPKEAIDAMRDLFNAGQDFLNKSEFAWMKAATTGRPDSFITGKSTWSHNKFKGKQKFHADLVSATARLSSASADFIKYFLDLPVTQQLIKWLERALSGLARLFRRMTHALSGTVGKEFIRSALKTPVGPGMPARKFPGHPGVSLPSRPGLRPSRPGVSPTFRPGIGPGRRLAPSQGPGPPPVTAPSTSPGAPPPTVPSTGPGAPPAPPAYVPARPGAPPAYAPARPGAPLPIGPIRPGAPPARPSAPPAYVPARPGAPSPIGPARPGTSPPPVRPSAPPVRPSAPSRPEAPSRPSVPPVRPSAPPAYAPARPGSTDPIPAYTGPGTGITGRTSIAALENDPKTQAAIERFHQAFPNVANYKTQLYSLVQGESGMGRNMVQRNQYAGYFALGSDEAYRKMGLSKQQFAALPFDQQLDAYTRWAKQNDPSGTHIRNLGLFNAASALSWQGKPDDTVVYPAGSREARANASTWGANSNAGGAVTIGGIKRYYSRNDPATSRQLNDVTAVAPAAPSQPFGPRQPFDPAKPFDPSRPAAPTTSTAPTAPIGPDQTGGGGGKFTQSQQGAGRSGQVSPQLEKQLGAVADRTGVNIDTFSGGEVPGGFHSGSGRHEHGGAADVTLYTTNPDGSKHYLNFNDPTDRAKIQQVIAESRRQGITGIGIGPGYMEGHEGTAVHLGGGTEKIWGEGGHEIKAPGWARQAFENPEKFPSTSGTQAVAPKTQQPQASPQWPTGDLPPIKYAGDPSKSAEPAEPAEPIPMPMSDPRGTAGDELIPEHLNPTAQLGAEVTRKYITELPEKDRQGLYGETRWVSGEGPGRLFEEGHPAIVYNPEERYQDPLDAKQTMKHELEHAGVMQSLPYQEHRDENREFKFAGSEGGGEELRQRLSDIARIEAYGPAAMKIPSYRKQLSDAKIMVDRLTKSISEAMHITPDEVRARVKAYQADIDQAVKKAEAARQQKLNPTAPTSAQGAPKPGIPAQGAPKPGAPTQTRAEKIEAEPKGKVDADTHARWHQHRNPIKIINNSTDVDLHWANQNSELSTAPM
jgi:hypothetical protein